MAGKDSDILKQILVGQGVLVEKVQNLDERLFGSVSQKGCIPVLFDRMEANAAHIQQVKDEALEAVQKTKDVEIKGLENDIVDLKTKAAITLWKTGTISGFAGSGVGVAATYLIKRIFGGH